MSADNRKFRQESGQESTVERPSSVDFDFLASQTFGDLALERDVLELFLAQARRVLPLMPAMSPQQQAETAHLVKGSARGIGAWGVAEAAARYEAAEGEACRRAMADLAAEVASAERAILARLAVL